MAYGNGRYCAITGLVTSRTAAAVLRNNGASWVAGTAFPAAANYQSIDFGAFNGGTFSTIAIWSALNFRVAPQQ